MELLLVLLVAVIIMSIADNVAKKIPQEQPKIDDCPPHRWSYKPEDGKMFCSKCLRYPGSYNTQNGEYDGK